MTDYQRIAKAISYINEHFQEQPELEQVAKEVFLSPFHFQRLFKEWAGVSPKKFLQFISIQHAKKLLLQQRSLAETTFETGLSGTGRLHDLFISIEGMTPGEYKNGGEQLTINYSFSETPFGKIIIASTPKGICHLAFAENEKLSFEQLNKKFPKATFNKKSVLLHNDIRRIFYNGRKNLSQIKLHLRGTSFQLKVWETLLKIPFGQVSTYADIAGSLHHPKAARAVGSAVANNPVAFLIPCHRVIKSTGVIGDYHWGAVRKKAVIGWEAAKTFGEN